MQKAAASVFSRVFGTALPQAGYLPASGTKGIFARMTGPETVGIIALQPRSGALPAVYCGIATVYCRALESACRQQPLSEWLNPLTFYYHAHYPDTWTRETLDRLEGKTPDSPETAARVVLQWTERLVLPQFSRVTDLQSAVSFLVRCGRIPAVCPAAERTADPDGAGAASEDLLCVKAGYQGDFLETLETRREYEQHRRSDAERGVETEALSYTEYAAQKREAAALLRQTLDRVLADPEAVNRTLAECERRRVRNLAYLRAAGILPDAPQGGITA